MLEHFDGTILLVSHDRYLIDHLATQIWELRGGPWSLPGSYREFILRKAALNAPRDGTAGAAGAQTDAARQ